MCAFIFNCLALGIFLLYFDLKFKLMIFCRTETFHIQLWNLNRLLNLKLFFFLDWLFLNLHHDVHRVEHGILDLCQCVKHDQELIILRTSCQQHKFKSKPLVFQMHFGGVNLNRMSDLWIQNLTDRAVTENILAWIRLNLCFLIIIFDGVQLNLHLNIFFKPCEWEYSNLFLFDL